MSVHEVISPLPGTFYRRPSPGAAPCKSEGDAIAPGDVLGLIEVMKQFSEICAEVAGKLVRFTVDDAAPIEPGQAIALIDTAPDSAAAPATPIATDPA